MPKQQVLEKIISNEDPLISIKQAINNYQEEMIPVPFLARLIIVKESTLNARLRRESWNKITVGKTNYISKEIAEKFAEMNAPLIRNWPSSSELASMCNPGNNAIGKITKTLARLCRKNDLEGGIDLTKKWRINPKDISKARDILSILYAPEVLEQSGIKYYSMTKTLNDAASILAKPGTPEFEKERQRLHRRFVWRIENDHAIRRKIGRTYYIPEEDYRKLTNPASLGYGKRIYSNKSPKQAILSESQEEKAIIENEENTQKRKIKSTHKEKIKQTLEEKAIVAPIASVVFKPDTHAVKLVSNPELNKITLNPGSKISREKEKNKDPEYSGLLVYNPDNPPSLKECVIGRSIKYGSQIGTIISLIEPEGFQPRIEVYFEEAYYKLKTLHLKIKSMYEK